MRKNLLLTAIVFMLAFAFNQSNAFAQKGSDENKIIELEKLLAEAIKNKKYDVFEKSFSGDYMGVYSYGISGRTKELEDIKSADIKEFSMSAIKVYFPEKNTAVIVYKCKVQGTAAGQDISGMYNVSSVWVLSNGKWLTVLHTEAKADETGN